MKHKFYLNLLFCKIYNLLQLKMYTNMLIIYNSFNIIEDYNLKKYNIKDKKIIK